MRNLHLVSGYDVLYPRVKEFIRSYLFGREIDLDSPNTLRNLSEPPVTKTIIETIQKAVNELTVRDKGDAEIRDRIKLRQTRPFIVKDQAYLMPKKTIFNRIVTDHGFEMTFASFIEGADDVVSFAKNYLAVNFRLDYVNAKGEISKYIPDFIVRVSDGTVYIVECKGREELDVPQKMERLRQWCEDVNEAQEDSKFDFVYVDQGSFETYAPKSFAHLSEGFREHKQSSV